MKYRMQFSSNKNPIITIKTDRITLTTPDIKNADLILDAVRASADDIYPWLPWATKEITAKDIENYINYFIKCHNSEKPSGLFFDVWLNEQGKYLGNVYFGQIEWRNPSFSIGYWLDSRECNKGYMTEAVNALSHVAFQHFKANRVEISTSKENVSAKRIPKKLNFELEAEFVNHHVNYATKEVSNTMVYSCVDTNRLPELKQLVWTTASQLESHEKIITWAKEFINPNTFESELIVETPWSSVIKINTGNEHVYLKQTPKYLFLEAEIIKLLCDKCDIKTIPSVIADNEQEHCFLMTKCGDISLRDHFDGKLQFDILKQAIISYKKLQHSTIEYIDELLAIGVPDWRLDKFPALYDELISNTEYLDDNNVTIEQQKQLHQYKGRVKSLCNELSNFGIIETLNHSDFHDNNLLYDKTNKTTAIIDLGETSVNHPLFSLHACIEAAKNRYKLAEDSSEYKSLQQCVFDGFLDNREQLNRAMGIINLLFPVYLLFAQKRFLDAIHMPFDVNNPLSVKQHEKINKGFVWFIKNMEATNAK